MIKVSPSSLGYWYKCGCPAAWNFDRKYTSLASKEWADRGTLVHKMMEGEIDPKTVEDRLAHTFYDKLRQQIDVMGIESITGIDGQPLQEMSQKFKIAPGVILSRRVDKAARYAGGDVLIDWKTTPGNGWKSVVSDDFKLVYPQSLGFQSIGYLLPPPKEDWAKYNLPPRYKWPKTILYIVAPLRGAVQVFQYDWNAKDYKNFLEAVEIVSYAVKKERFPKVRDRHCVECNYRQVCYQAPDWESLYDER